MSPGPTITDPAGGRPADPIGASPASDAVTGMTPADVSTNSADSARAADSGPGPSATADPTRPATGRRIRIAATSRWAIRPTPARDRAGAASSTRPAGARRAARRSSASWVRTSTTRASTNRSQTSHPMTARTPTTMATSSPISTRPCPGQGLPTMPHSASGTPTTTTTVATRAPTAAPTRRSLLTAHAPVVTPSVGVEVDDVETDRPPGRMR